MKTGALATAVLAPVAGLLLFLVIICGGATGGTTLTAAAAATPTCSRAGQLPGLDAVQSANAHTVVATAENMAGQRAAVIAVSVALAESGMRDLGNPHVPGSATGQGTGADHDSVGLFQQRPSWGSLAERLDPATSTRLFVARLLAVAGWKQLSPWLAAQAVQRSAHGDGANYRATLARAREIVAHAGGGAHCDTLTGGSPATTRPGSHGLPDDYTIPAAATQAETAAISYALAQLDKPYVFGAAGPDAFDCSGLTMAAWDRGGVTLPHFTGSQARAGTPVADPSAMRPGDLILVPGDDGTLAAPRHVGMYLGHGLVVNASSPKTGIRVQTYTDFVTVGHGLSGIRHIR